MKRGRFSGLAFFVVWSTDYTDKKETTEDAEDTEKGK
jgi:hypothetical protein